MGSAWAKAVAARPGLRTEDESETIKWVAFPGPQTAAYHSEADELLYGGAAGGGKSDLLIGLALTAHRNSIIFRREYPQLEGLIERSREIVGNSDLYNGTEHVWRLTNGRRLKFGAVQQVQDWEKFAGRARDLIGFDELAHFAKLQYLALIGWNRTSVAGQRCRVVAATNPPAPGQDGAWILEAWAPWLDPEFPKSARLLDGAPVTRAEPGELRWYAMLEGNLTWVPSGVEFEWTDSGGKAETIQPKSRSFIPAKVQDNPVYMETGYIRTLQALPEPLRSLLLNGDFNATTEDNPWQCIPTLWVMLAQERFRQSAGPQVSLSALGVDPARGGKDQTVLSPRFGSYFAELQKHPGKTTPDGPAVAALVVQALEAEHATDAAVNIDPIAVGTSPLDILRANNLTVNAINFAAGSPKDSAGKPLTDKSGKYKFLNLRAAAYWALREALDPESGMELALPDDRELLADLCAPTYKVTTGGIQLESKEDISKRLGRSPDCGDAVVYAHWIAPEGVASFTPWFGAVSRK